MKFEFTQKDVENLLVNPIPWTLWPDKKSAVRVHEPNLYRPEQTRHQSFEVPPSSVFWHQCQTVLNLKTYWAFCTRDYPGYVIPPHRDNHSKFREHFGLDDSVQVNRYWVSLTNQQFGHVLCVDGELIQYEAGEVLYWGNKIHSAANIGFSPRVLIMITGSKDE